MGEIKLKELSNSFSTGGGGMAFEYSIQAVFLLSLLIDGFSPVLNIPVKKVSFQAKRLGYETDDLVVEAEGDYHSAKLLCQIKHTITISENDKTFKEVINAAWADFKKTSFNKKHDRIALATSFIAKDSIYALRLLNDKAIHSDTAESFNQDINENKYVSQTVRDIKRKIETCLQIANNNIPISIEEIWEFFKIFILLIFDLDYRNSINETLTMTLIKMKTMASAVDVWARIVKYASECDRSGAVVTLDNFDIDILETLGRVTPNDIKVEYGFKSNELFSKLVLIGSWNEQNEEDKDFVARIVGQPYSKIEKELQSLVIEHHPYISFEQGIWKIKNRRQIFENSYNYYFDNFICLLFDEATKVLTKNNKRIDEETGEENILISNKECFDNSTILRKALVQGLCLIANSEEKIINCTSQKISYAAYLFLKNIFDDCAWLRLASLYDLIPLIAEIKPKEYLRFLEKVIRDNPDALIRLFPLKATALLRPNYICGILWSLEGLAWGEEYLVSSIRCLCELAMLEVPISNSGNTPINSLTNILLPWYPQTMATTQKRKNAIAVALKGYPKIGWKLLKNIMPGGITTTCGNYKPKYYMHVPKEQEVLRDEMWDMQDYIVEQALEMAGQDAEKLSQIVQYFYYIGESTIEKFISDVDDFSKNWNDEEKFVLWLKLNDFRYKIEGDEEKDITKIAFYAQLCNLIQKIEPKDLFIKSKRLFLSSFDEYSMWEYSHDRWKLKQERKKNIIKDLYATYGIDGVRRFGVQIEKEQYEIYRSFGKIILHTDMCNIVEQAVQDESWFYFLVTVLNTFLRENGTKKLFELNFDRFDKEIVAKILGKIDLSKDLIQAVEVYLSDKENLYWEKALMPRIYDDSSDYDIKKLIDKLVQYKRYATIINMLWHTEIISILSEQEMMDILYQAAKVSCIDKLDIYATQTIIEQLQNSPNTDREKLSNIEFMYLPWLDKHSGHYPKALKVKLANDPAFFCEIIELFYKKRHDETPKESLDQMLGERLFSLLYPFNVVPGVDWDGVFHAEQFKNWIDYALTWGKENDRDEVVQQTIGGGLSYAQKDEDGLIDEILIMTLDLKGNEQMRKGYMTGVYNQRGVHFIDPNGKPEKELSLKYQALADRVEEKGYSRFADTLRRIADNYLQEAKDNIISHQIEEKMGLDED